MKTTHKATGYTDTYQKITDYVLAELEKGKIIWQQGWNSSGFPKNIISNQAYRGWNVFFLNFATLINGYAQPHFITFKQAQAKGGTIRKGEKGYPIVYWAKIEDKRRTIVTKDQQTGDETSRHPAALVPKYYTVFNVDQTEGLDDLQTPIIPAVPVNTITACEEIVTGMPHPPRIDYQRNGPYYNRVTDTVVVPPASAFIHTEEMYCTLFHELGHATGHPSRLNRKELVESDGFGHEVYSREELTAELTAAYLCGVAGIEQSTLRNSTAYIQGWLAALRNDKTLVIKAAAQAQKAADYILHVPPTQEPSAATAAA